jgi:isopentenyl diphosphate isomerase/L-lactate dehydrogenase-like FMN-dependent dehydrogenase
MEPWLTRRRTLQYLAGLPASCPSMRAQELIGEPPGRIAPLADLVNVFEMQAMARRKLSGNVYAAVAGTDHQGFEKITFRPRLMVNVAQLDLTTELLGEKMFAPILAGPIWYQQAFHPEGEVAMVRGASAAKTLMVVSSRSSRPLAEIAEAAKTPLWFQVYPEPDIKATIQAAQRAVQAGCKAVCLTIGAPYQAPGPGGQVSSPVRLQAAGSLKMDWTVVEQIRRSVKVPVVLKGIMSPEEARTAADRGIDAMVVSNHGALFANGFAEPIAVLPSIAAAVGGKIPILIDGSFRRGTDILKALALGARAVLLARPLVWGLAAYGAEGVQAVLEMVQSELARNMAHCGKPDIKSIDSSLVKIHKR